MHNPECSPGPLSYRVINILCDDAIIASWKSGTNRCVQSNSSICSLEIETDTVVLICAAAETSQQHSASVHSGHFCLCVQNIMLFISLVQPWYAPIWNKRTHHARWCLRILYLRDAKWVGAKHTHTWCVKRDNAPHTHQRDYLSPPPPGNWQGGGGFFFFLHPMRVLSYKQPLLWRLNINSYSTEIFLYIYWHKEKSLLTCLS